MKWTQIKVTGKSENCGSIAAVLTLFDPHLLIDDPDDIAEINPVYGELIDETLLQKKGISSVSIFISEEINVFEIADLIKTRLNLLEIPYDFELLSIDEDDWANNWKQYYKTLKIGKNIVIVPEWENYNNSENEIKVIMDPGMAFGTGTHESTQLCAVLLEKYLKQNTHVLDIGTGSGILAIIASKFGAAFVDAYDIDPMAVRVAGENIKLNNCENVSVNISDLLSSVSGIYDFITANITAEIIMKMASEIKYHMKKGSVLAVSGVIASQRDEVYTSLINSGLVLIDEIYENDWCGLCFIL